MRRSALPILLFLVVGVVMDITVALTLMPVGRTGAARSRVPASGPWPYSAPESWPAPAEVYTIHSPGRTQRWWRDRLPSKSPCAQVQVRIGWPSRSWVMYTMAGPGLAPGNDGLAIRRGALYLGVLAKWLDRSAWSYIPVLPQTGLALNATLYAAAAFTAAHIPRWSRQARRRLRRRHSLCPRRAYPAVASAVCPECGTLTE